jgi:hypothetical protein
VKRCFAPAAYVAADSCGCAGRWDGALARFLASPRGLAYFDRLLLPDVAKIVRRAHAAEVAAGGHELAARSFVPPDPAQFVAELDDLVRNMPAA